MLDKLQFGTGDRGSDGGDPSGALVTAIIAALVATSAMLAGMGGAGAATNEVDIVFVFDTSGSMGPYQDGLANEVEGLADSLESSGIDARYALVDYESGAQVEQTFTSDQTTIKAAIEGLAISGGSEDASDAILTAFDDLNYRSDAKKVIVVITDEDDDSSSSVRQDALDRVESEDALLVAVSPDRDGDDELKTMAESVDGLHVTLPEVDFGDVTVDFSEVISALTETIEEEVGDGEPEEIPDVPNPRFEVTDRSVAPTDAAVGEPINVSFTVTNVGDGAGYYAAIVTADGERIHRERFKLEPDESREVSFSHAFDERGSYQLFVRTKYLDVVKVTRSSAGGDETDETDGGEGDGGEGDDGSTAEPAPGDRLFDNESLNMTTGVVDATLDPANVTASESYDVVALVHNAGSEPCSFWVMFQRDGEHVAFERVELEPGETRTVRYTADPVGDGSAPSWAANTVDAGNVTVVEAAAA